MFLIAFIAATVFVLLGLVYATRSLRAEVRTRFYEQYNQQQLILAQQAADTIEELFDSVQRSLTLASRLLQWRDLALDNSTTLFRELKTVQEVMEGSPVVEFVIFDEAGTVVSILPEDDFTLGRNFAWREYFKWARDRGGPGQIFLTPFMHMEGGQFRGSKALLAAEGLYDFKGRFRGVVAVLIDFDELARQHVLSIKIGKDGYAWLIDNDSGSVLVDPLGRISGQTFEEAFLPRWPKLYSLVESSSNAQPGMDWYDYEDPVSPELTVRKLVGHAPVRVIDRLWTLGVCTPIREPDALVASLLRQQNLLSGISIAATIMGALLLAGLLLFWNRTLSHVVDTRTREVEKLQSRLGQAQKMEAIGTLAGGIAHDFNNILTPIIGFAQYALKSTPDDTAQKGYLEQIEAAGLRAQNLVAQILAFARKGEHERQLIRLGPIVKEILKLLEASLPKTIEIRQQIETEDDLTIADPTNIHQLLMNLCTNAYQAMGDEPGALDIELKPIKVDVNMAAHNPALKVGPYLELAVTDSGSGMDKEVVQHIFEPFFTTKGVGEGTGMGLSVVHGIVKGLGGAILVYSEPGHGTTFHVYLPRVIGVEVEKPPAEEPVERGSENVLFVDDEEAIADLAKLLLESLGYKVTIKTNSIEALELFRKNPHDFDLVITDQTMPKMTGLSLIREILKVRPEMPTILTTGFSGAILAEKVEETAVRELVVKPFNAKKLGAAIRKALEH